MASPLEDYALIGDCQTAALVSREGSIDWLCFPRFDSGACFAALLGGPEHGRWLISPAGKVTASRRRYRGDTLVLETDFETVDGAVTLVDCMPLRDEHPNLVRLVVGRRGRVAMRMELVIRFDYGSIVPWVRRQKHGGGIWAIAGPDTLLLNTPVELCGEQLTTVAEFTVEAGQKVPFVLTWQQSHKSRPDQVDAALAVQATEDWWRQWSGRCKYQGRWREAVLRSLITLKALTFQPTGGIVAAPTTSLPEFLGGVRNWDYRYCWLRDATFTLDALIHAGYEDEAAAWRDWLLRAVAGDPSKLQIMYGVAGERRLIEFELQWLPGYEGSGPVRVGNAASEQFQLDVFGELLDMLHQCRRARMPADHFAWALERAILEFLETAWQRPDEGIWEVRGGRKHFTHSKVMAWVAFDRAIRAVEQFGAKGPVDRWRKTRQAIHDQVCTLGFNKSLGAFVQHYGSDELDASLLMIPLVGFLPADDARVRSTVGAVERDLLHDGFVSRYRTHTGVDGLPPGEGAFLPCSFWLVDNLALLGRREEAERLFERLLGLRTDLGLMAEQYDPKLKRMVGNFPQAFTHVALVNSAQTLSRPESPDVHRAR